MLFLVFSDDPDLVTDLYEVFTPDLFVQLVGWCFDGLQGRAADKVYDYQNADEFEKRGVACPNSLLNCVSVRVYPAWLFCSTCSLVVCLQT
jgi:hypothetical protein